MSAPSVSVVLPVYNSQSTLEAALDSIRRQTFEDWELLVCDDGSTDASLAVAEKSAALDRRIRVLPGAHEGIVATLRRGCAEARGAFIARMDADDAALAQRLERQVALLASDTRIGLCGTRVTMTGKAVGLGLRRYEAWINGLVTHEEMVRELFVECPLPHPTFLMRREAYEAVGGYAGRGWAEDYDLCMRFWMAGWRLGKVPEPLLQWRESPGRLSRSNPCYSPEAFRALKRHYLFQTYLKDRTFHQWGAGEVGKQWLREWAERTPAAVVDINPRKIGRRIHGVPVVAPDDLPRPGETYIVVAVGAPGARDDIRAWLGPRGYEELRDYVFLA